MLRQIKIGFILATNEVDIHWFRPLAFGYLKAYVEEYSNKPVIFSFVEDLSEASGFDVIAISSTSQDFGRAIDIAHRIKQIDERKIVIIGGHHITYLPDTLSEDMDIGVIGEGERTFLEIVEYFCENGLVVDTERLKKIKGLALHDEGVLITGKRELITSLDEIPHPFRQDGETPYIFTSRGCPYRCSFCSSSVFWDKTRFFSAEYVVEEIEIILNQFPKTKNIQIYDDLFIANLPRLKKIVEIIEEKGINEKVGFSFAVRANLVSDDLCETIKRLKEPLVNFGIESGSDRVLALLGKNVTVQQNQAALDKLHKHSMPVSCSFIIGVPTETEEEVRATYNFIIRNIFEGKLGWNSSINILMPMPGTKIWDYAVKEKIIELEKFDWNRLSIFASFRTSTIPDFSDWLKCRRNNNSVYLNEKYLSQERLYRIMEEYESIISFQAKYIQDHHDLEKERARIKDLLNSTSWKITSPLRLISGILRRNRIGI